MQEEMTTLINNGSWTLGSLPTGKVVGCKWVYSIKFQSDGTVDWSKAQLVAKGYSQTPDVYFHEIFSPIAELNYVRVLISLAVNQDGDLFQWDVKNAFLHGDLQE